MNRSDKDAMPDRPSVTINADGTYADANRAALELLGVTLDQLRTSSPGRFAVEPDEPVADEAFREAWESTGRPDLAGATSIRRADGRTVRIKFAIHQQEDGSFLALLDPAGEPVAAPTTVFTTGDVLAAWRAAERKLEALTPDHPDAVAVQADIVEFRARYQALFERGRHGAS